MFLIILNEFVKIVVHIENVRSKCIEMSKPAETVKAIYISMYLQYLFEGMFSCCYCLIFSTHVIAVRLVKILLEHF